MHKRRTDTSTVRISDEEYSRLESKFEGLRNEFLICKRKLDSKCEALLILSQELDQCRSERDQFKLMAEQLRERCQSMKKQLSGKAIPPSAENQTLKYYSDMQSQSLAKLLCDTRDQNKSLQFEVDDLKQKLQDAWGDIKLLREQIARQRVGTSDEGLNTRHFPAHEREDLVQQLEAAKDQYLQLERDLQQVLDEKEELVTERDVYKTKYERLNQELNYILKGDENRVVDIDALVMENKYLQERMKQMEEEKTMAMAAVNKYKTLLERRKTKGCMKLGQVKGPGLVISQKQVRQVLDSPGTGMATPQAMSDLQALAGALLDTVNDKNLALSHQRKTNKILGSRVSELEKKIKTLEVAGLWNVPTGISASLEKLRAECDEVKTLVPRQSSQSSDKTESESNKDGNRTESESIIDADSELGSVSPLDSIGTTPDVTPTHRPHRPQGQGSFLGRVEMEDLDLLPTKEVSCRPILTGSGQGDSAVSIFMSVPQRIGELPKEESFSLSDHLFSRPNLSPTDNSSKPNLPYRQAVSQLETLTGSGDSECVDEDSEGPPAEEDSSVGCNVSLTGSEDGEKEEDQFEDKEEEEEEEETVDDLETMHVYSMDKTDEEDEKDRSGEGEESLCISAASEAANQSDEDQDDLDEVTAEKMGLLMGSMAQKMKDISHVGENCVDVGLPSGANFKTKDGVRVEDGSANESAPSSPSNHSRLLSKSQNATEDQPVSAAVVDDVEC